MRELTALLTLKERGIPVKEKSIWIRKGVIPCPTLKERKIGQKLRAVLSRVRKGGGGSPRHGAKGEQILNVASF